MWDQLLTLTAANLRARYRKTIAGFLWVVLNPVIMFLVQAMIFKSILRVNIQHYDLFLLSGLLPWIFLQASLQMSVTCFVTQGRLLKSYPVSPLVYLGAQVLDNIINFVAAFVLVLIPVWAFSSSSSVSIGGILMLPLAVAVMALGTAALAWLLATLQVFYRDTVFVLTFVLGVAFFVTPIFYPPEMLSGVARVLVEWNPLYLLIAPFRAAIYGFQGHFVFSHFFYTWAIAMAEALVATVCAILLWRARRSTIYFNI